MRRATWPPSDTALTPWDFNPRSPCGERPGPGCKLGGRTSNFNPRSPCGERPDYGETKLRTIGFQSTLSLRRATKALLRGLPVSPISIHALLAESDQLFGAVCEPNSDFNPRSPCGERHDPLSPEHRFKYFNPRSPCGERLPLSEMDISANGFQSTLSLRRATCQSGQFPPKSRISIHALLAESDSHSGSFLSETVYFNPRSPCGERRMDSPYYRMQSTFQSTLSLRRAT